MEPLFDFIQTTGGKVLSIVLGALVVIIAVAWVDRHSSKPPEPEKKKEPTGDDH